MNPSTRGLSSAGKAGIVVVLIVLVLGAAYLAPSLSKGSGTQSTTTSQTGTVDTQAIGAVSLFGYFSQMQLSEYVVDNSLGEPVTQQTSVEYVVLGKGTINSTQYTKVGFSQTGTSAGNVVAWFNPSGVIDRVDVFGQRNYTGNAAFSLPVARIYTTAFGLIPTITNNATLLAMLSQTSQNTTSIGPTQLSVATYHLVVPTAPYTSITVKYATIPGTNLKIVVYLDEKTTDGSETTIQILSLTK